MYTRWQDLDSYQKLIERYNNNADPIKQSHLNSYQREAENKEILDEIIQKLVDEEGTTVAWKQSMEYHILIFGRRKLKTNLKINQKPERLKALKAERLKAKESYFKLLNEVQIFAENFASDIAKRYIDEIEAIERYGSNAENEVLKKPPTRFSIEGEKKYDQQNQKTFEQIKPELFNANKMQDNAPEITNAIVVLENDEQLKIELDAHIKTLETAIKVSIAKAEYDEDPDLARRIRISNDQLWMEQQIKDGKFHTLFESKDPRDAKYYIPSEKQNIFLPTIQAIGISETISKLKPDNKLIGNLTKAGYEERTRAALKSLTGKKDVQAARNSRKEWNRLQSKIFSERNAALLLAEKALPQPATKKLDKAPAIKVVPRIPNTITQAEINSKIADKKLKQGKSIIDSVENFSYLDYIKQSQNPFVRYFDMAIQMIRSFFSGTISTRMEASKKQYGHERFWKSSPIRHLNHVVKTQNRNIQQMKS